MMIMQAYLSVWLYLQAVYESSSSARVMLPYNTHRNTQDALGRARKRIS